MVLLHLRDIDLWIVFIQGVFFVVVVFAVNKKDFYQRITTEFNILALADLIHYNSV